jgi:hypothetical protein
MFRQALVVVASLSFAGVAVAEPETPTKKAPTKKSTATKSTKTSTKSPTTKTTKSTTTAAKKTTKKSTKTKSSTPRKRGTATKGTSAARVPWVPTRSTLANTQNLPSGFTWPPTHPMLEAEKECEGKLDRAGVVWERAERDGRIVDAIVGRRG